jgi:hypothetical protein
MKYYILISIIYLFTINCYTQNKNNHDLPAHFSDSCYAHIKELAGYGLRTTDLKSGLKTISYLTSKLNENGLHASIDTFAYKSFKYDSAVISYHNQRVRFSTIFINPYLKEVDSTFELYFLNIPLKDLKDTLNDKIIIAPASYSLYDLFKIQAKAIVIVADSLHRKLKEENQYSKAFLKLYGNIEEHESYNVRANINSFVHNARDIIISAHWDSKVGPGADDDASGISVMLELAKYFQQQDSIPFNLKFIAFGAEEVGLLGSQAYLNKHSAEFENCVLNINLDGIGGNQEIMMETHQSSKEDINAFQKLPSSVRLCSCTDERHRWILISPEFYAATLFTEINQIPWIDETLKRASADINVNFRYGLSDGDHRILSLSGIPVIGINVPGNRYHVPGDTPETISKTSLKNVGNLVKDIISKIKFEKNYSID